MTATYTYFDATSFNGDGSVFMYHGATREEFINAECSAMSKRWAVGTFDKDQYYMNETDEVMERPEPTHLYLDGMFVRGVTGGVLVVIDDIHRYSLPAEDVELDFAIAGTYKVSVEQFPFKPAIFQVTKP